MKPTFSGPMHPLAKTMSQGFKALMLSSGFLFLAYFVILFAEPMLPRVVDEDAPAGTWERPQITPNGLFYVSRPKDTNQFVPYTPAGEPIFDNLYQTREPGGKSERLYPDPPQQSIFNEGGKSDPVPPHGLLGFGLRGSTLEYWYLIQHRDPTPHGYFIGYDSVTGSCLGYIGATGLIDHAPTLPESIPLAGINQGVLSPPRPAGSYYAGTVPGISADIQYWDYEYYINRKVWLATPEGIWECNLGNRTSRFLVSAKGILVLNAITDLTKKTFSPLVRTQDSILLFDESGKETHRAHRPLSPKPTTLEVFALEKGTLVVADTVYPKSKGAVAQSTITWYDKKGGAEKELVHSLNKFQFPGTVQPEEPIISANHCIESIMGGLGLVTHLTEYQRNGGSLIPPKALPYVLANGVMTLGVILFMVWCQTRRGQPVVTTLGWALYLLILGATGFFGYLFHKAWPALVPCERCGKKRVVDCELCPKCGAAFPKATIKGTEILHPEPIRLMSQTA